jgi:hypothetical protein
MTYDQSSEIRGEESEILISNFVDSQLLSVFTKTESPASLGRFAKGSRPPAVKFAPLRTALNYLGQAARSFAAMSLYSASDSFLLGAGVPGAFPPKEGMT